MKSYVVRLMILLIALVLEGCDFGAIPPTATPLPPATSTVVAIPTVVATSTPALTATPQASSLHFTRAQFDDALALWQAQGIVEYEVTINYTAYSSLMGRWTLHVRPTGDGSEVLEYVRDPKGSVPPTGGLGAPGGIPTAEPAIAELKEYLQSLSIESRFAELKALLDDPTKDQRSLVDYYVLFEPTLGYPVLIQAVDKPQVADAGYTWGVSRLKVLKHKSDGNTP